MLREISVRKGFHSFVLYTSFNLGNPQALTKSFFSLNSTNFTYFFLFAVISKEKTMSEWKQGLCNCCQDGETCLLGFPCCLSCTSYRNAKGLGQPTPLLYGLLGCFLPCFAINILRGKAREQHRTLKSILIRFKSSKKNVKSRKF